MALAAVAAFAGAAVQSATGFGFALVLSPALFAVMDPVEAVTALLALGLALNLLVLFEGGPPEHVDWRALAPMLVAALPGLAVGAVALTQLSKEVLQVAVGVAVILAAGWQLRAPRARLSPVAAGLASGALTTSISVSGPPLVLWLRARGVEPEEFRASLAASFLVLNVAGGVVLLAAEGSGAFDGGAIALLLAVVVAGYAVGAVAFRRLDRELFFNIVLALVALTGLASVVAGLT
jgi:uncharacterized protein